MQSFLRDVIRRRAGLMVGLVGLFVPMVSGCNAPTPDSPPSSGTTAESSKAPDAGGAAGSDKLVIEGSNTMLPLSQKWTEEFKKVKSTAQITVSGEGSGQGIASLINGTCQIANASRSAKDKEKADAKAKGFEMTETAVARDGITIVVNPSNTVKSLTVEQLAKIYAGQIQNWKEVGGPDAKIVTSGRETTSGTYAFFQEDVIHKLGKETKYRSNMISTPSNNKIAENVTAQPGGIGYIGVAYATEFVKSGKVKEVPIAFKEGDEALLPTADNVLSGKYPISRALYCYTRNAPEGIAKEYLDFITGPEGQKVVVAEGYIPLKK
jgi:phosphate transport system substrate-binding protein